MARARVRLALAVLAALLLAGAAEVYKPIPATWQVRDSCSAASAAAPLKVLTDSTHAVVAAPWQECYPLYPRSAIPGSDVNGIVRGTRAATGTPGSAGQRLTTSSGRLVRFERDSGGGGRARAQFAYPVCHLRHVRV